MYCIQFCICAFVISCTYNVHGVVIFMFYKFLNDEILAYKLCKINT